MNTPTLMLAQAIRMGIAPLEAKVLAAYALDVPRVWLITHGDDVLTAAQIRAVQTVLDRRANGWWNLWPRTHPPTREWPTSAAAAAPLP
jgi:release factor glutamine methyltransferase